MDREQPLIVGTLARARAALWPHCRRTEQEFALFAATSRYDCKRLHLSLEFEEDGRVFDSQIATNDNDMCVMISMACADGGLTVGLEATFCNHLDSDTLAAVLERFCLPFAGFFLYFPDRRNHVPELRA